MRVMVIVKADRNSEAGILPTQKILADMEKFNEELVKAGVMLAGEGLQPSSKGVRVRFSGDKRIVTNGPFPETNDLVAGFWIWQVKSTDEAAEWLKRAPFDQTEVEIRQVYEMADLAPSDPTGEIRKKEEELRKAIAAGHH
ncbi:MAG: YciI family protein [Bryobacteraceae bacterium]